MSAQPEISQADQVAVSKYAAPPAVFELTDAESIASIGELSESFSLWRDAAFADNPFRSHPVEGDISSSVFEDGDINEHRVAQLTRADSQLTDDICLEGSRDVAREQGPQLAATNRNTVVRLKEIEEMVVIKLASLISNSPLFDETESVVIDPETVEAEQAELRAIAELFPTKKALSDAIRFLDWEERALLIDALVTGARKNPQLVTKRQAIVNSPDLTRAQALALNKEVVDELFAKGKHDRGVKKIHRSSDEIESDRGHVHLSQFVFETHHNDGNTIFEKIRGVAAQGMVVVALELAAQLRAIKAENDAALAAAKEQQQGYGDDIHLQAVEVEGYIRSIAQTITATLQQAKFRGDIDQRRLLRSITADEIGQSYRRARKSRANSVGTVSVQAEIAPDPEVRKMYAAAHRIATGGNRIEDRRAPALAKDLHRLRLASEGNQSLERHESGMLVALFTGKIEPLFAAIDRVKAPDADADAQLRLLRSSHPQYFHSITGIQVGEAIKKLQALLENPYNQNQLLNPLMNCGMHPPRTHIQTALETLKSLKQKYCPETVEEGTEQE